MKEESSAFLKQAEIMLRRAAIMLTVGLNEDGARASSLACFHVAQAFIFERTGRALKSHNGVQTEFLRLSRLDERVDAQLRRFLSQAYEFKSVADYGTGPDAITSAEAATQALATARQFVSHFQALVTPSDPGPSSGG